MMALRREQPVEQVEQIAGKPGDRGEKDKEWKHPQILLRKTAKTPQLQEHEKPPPGPTADELDKHETHARCVSFPGAKHCISSRAKEDPHRSVATHEGRTPKSHVGLDVFSQAIKNQVFNCQCWWFMTFLLVL